MEMEPVSKKAKKAASGGGAPGTVLRDDCEVVLRDDGSVDAKMDPGLEPAELHALYRTMVRVRMFDERAMMLQRQGRIGFYVPSHGQEAIQAGTAAALEKKDWVFPSYREPGLFLHRGASVYQMLCNLWGNADDLCKGRQMPVHYSFPEQRLFSVSSPIATQVIQAAGAALASKIRKTGEVAATYFGDGGTSENDFHTGMTFAGSFKAPVVFVCTNNQFAISVPLHKQCGTGRLVEKARGYGMPGIAVDGNDVLAVYRAMKEAVDYARSGKGPFFLECFTLRMGPHSSSDDPARYRDAALYEAWRKRDPIDRFRNHLAKKKLWDDKREAALREEITKELATAIEKAEAQPQPAIDTLFDDVFAKTTPQLEKQREAMRREQELRGAFENTSVAFPL